MKSCTCRIMSTHWTSPHGIILVLFLSLTLLRLVSAQQPSGVDTSDGYTADSGNVNPSMAVIVIVLVFAFFITGFISILIQQCANSSRPIGNVSVISGPSRRGTVRGLDQSTIDTFPTFVYSAVKELKIGKGSLECAVCLNEFEEDETLRLIPKCDHVFHRECIDAWLAGHTTCPVCRADLLQPGELTHRVEDDDDHVDHHHPPPEVRIEVKEAMKREWRSHSTGHSLSRLGAVEEREMIERFTLRLPTEVRRQIVARARLMRATSLVALPRESSSRRGYRIGGGGEGSGSSRYGRMWWPFGAKVGGEGDVGSKRVMPLPLGSLPHLPV